MSDTTIERLLYDQIDMLRARNKELEAALRKIADDPCLDPEGNAEIARKALQKSDRK